MNSLLFDTYPILLPVNDLFLRGLLEKVGNVLIQGLKDLDQTVQGDGRQVPFDLGDEPLGQISPLGQLLLGQIAQLSQISDPLPDLHNSVSALYKEFGLIICKKV